MDKNTKIFLAIIIVLVIGGISAAVVATMKEKGGNGTAKLTLETTGFDWGDVSMAAGLAKKNIKIQNTGTGDLKISKFTTSCMCTKVTLEVNGRRSPDFGMPGHGDSGPAFWSETIKPGDSGTLEIIFDPNAHGPEATGPITRAIYIYSNDGGSSNSKKTINFDANVVKGEIQSSPIVAADGEILSASQNGVEIAIQNIKRENNKTIVEFTADNHVFDLSTMDVKAQSKLAGVAASGYSIIENGGGHHLRAALTFDGNLSGTLTMRFNKDLIFNLNIK
ncbi:MAG: DUF1573 domain-containing protein [Patescibacteria group bacterium]